MTRLLATIVFVAALAVSVAPASAQYPYGGIYGGFGSVYVPQTYYGGYNNYNYGYNTNGYRANYGYNQNYRSSYNNYGHNHNHGHHGGNYGNQSGYGMYRANGGPVTLPDGNTVSGFKNVIVLPPGYTVQGGF